MTTQTKNAPRRRVTMERTYEASVEDVWELWTTKEGIESWWGPDGFVVRVRRIDVRPGGGMEYTMVATGAEQIAFLERAGMPVALEHRLTYTEVVPLRRLAYTQLADFIPGVDPYDIAMLVELFPSGGTVRMVTTFDAMHDERWTELSVAGWEMELAKLAKVLTRAA